MGELVYHKQPYNDWESSRLCRSLVFFFDKGIMKAKCIKADPLGWLNVGETYELYKKGNIYIVERSGFAVNEKNFNEMFEIIKN